MLTLRELTALQPTDGDAWVLSVYLDGRATDPAKRAEWSRWLDRTLRDERRGLVGASHREREAFDAAVAALLAQLPARDRAIGARGWVGFASGAGVLHAEPLPVAVPSLVVWRAGAHVAPYVGALRALAPVVVAVVDTKIAALHRYQGGSVTPIDTLRTQVRARPALHMGNAPRQGFHTGTRGVASVDAAETSRLVGIERMVAALVDRLTAELRDDAWLVLGGTADAVHRVRAALPDALGARLWVSPTLHDGASPAQVAVAAEEGAAARRDAHDLAQVVDVIERYARDGLGAAGLDAVRRAIAEGNVHALLVTPHFLDAQAATADAIVRAAVQQHASIALVGGAAAERLDAAGAGIGARLRFVGAPVVLV
jgi:hypothetical protein